MPGIEFIRQLFQQASAQGSKSTALNPLGWALAIVLSAVLGSVGAKAPLWLTVLLSVFAAAVLVLYLFAYVFFMFKDRDALRSERFSLSKMAIERSVKGDNLTGFEIGKDQSPLALPAIMSHTEKIDG